MKKLTIGIVLLFLVLIGISCRSAKNSKTPFDTNKKEVYIDSMMSNALEKGFFPGAQISVGSKDSKKKKKNYGYHDYSKKELVKTEDVYDLASMSKVLGATLVAMRLVGENKMKLQDKLGDVVAVYKHTAITDLKLFELLTHTSGLKPSIIFYQTLLSTVDGSPLLSSQKSDVYPDLFDNMYVNKNIVYDAKYLSFEPRDSYIQVYKDMWLNPDFYTTMYEKIALAKTNTRGNYLDSGLNVMLVQQMMESKTGLKLDQLANQMYDE